MVCGMWYEVCGLRYELRDLRYELRDMWYVVLVYDILGMRETGLTLREDPITISRSA